MMALEKPLGSDLRHGTLKETRGSAVSLASRRAHDEHVFAITCPRNLAWPRRARVPIQSCARHVAVLEMALPD